MINELRDQFKNERDVQRFTDLGENIELRRKALKFSEEAS